MRLKLWAGLVLLGLAARRRRRATGIARISRVVADLDRAEAFYRDALGFRRVHAGPLDPAVARALLPCATARTVRLRLGDDELELVRWDRPGPAYPPGSRSDDLWFQHLAIVVSAMDAASARVRSAAPISTGGPAALPSGINAYKFRDPDGHPLELIHFPPGQGRAVWERAEGLQLGIDHTAIAVRDTRRSRRFYRGLGLRPANHSRNHGPAQSALDGIPGARVEVTGLRPPSRRGPGIELLAYDPPGRNPPCTAATAIATDWITLRTGRRSPRGLRDPDGHLLLLDR